MNKLFVTSLAGVIFAVCAFFHVALPAAFTQEAFIGAATLVFAAATAVLRFSHGDPLDGVKRWYQSKTVWSAAIAALFAVLALFGIVPGIDPATIVATIMGLLGLVSSVLGLTSKSAIG